MDHFIDITVKPDAKMRVNVLMNKVYTQLHLTLCTLESQHIGVSFPKYKVLLGNVLRIHGSVNRLLQLQATPWLGEMMGYCNVSETSGVPEGVHHRVCSREQANMSKSKLNRLIARGTIEPHKVEAYMTKMFEQCISNPYFELESASNGQKYRRYIAFGPLSQTPSLGNFDQFGLSQEASVPWF